MTSLAETQPDAKTDRCNVQVPTELHRKLRIHVAKKGVKIRNFVAEAISEKLETEGAEQ